MISLLAGPYCPPDGGRTYHTIPLASARGSGAAGAAGSLSGGAEYIGTGLETVICGATSSAAGDISSSMGEIGSSPPGVGGAATAIPLVSESSSEVPTAAAFGSVTK